jgi:hypothetical protein
MYLYSITINIDDDVQKQWLEWMKETFIPELFKTGLFTSRNFLQLINEEKSEGTTYSLQLFMNSLEDYEKYEAEFCYSHQVIMYTAYQNKFVELRTFLKLLE